MPSTKAEMRQSMRPRLARTFTPAKRLILVSFLMDLGAGAMLLAVQFRGISLGAPPLVLGFLGTASFLVYILMALVAGRISDRLGRKSVTIVACLITALTWLAMIKAANAYHLLVLATISGGGLGLLWAPVQAWLGDLSGGSARLLNRHLGIFNIAWTAGLMLGPLLVGMAWERWRELAFLVPAGAAFGCLLAALLTPAGERTEETVTPPERVNPELVWVFMIMAWVGVFATSFARGMVASMFPKLGDELGYSPALVGRLLFMLGAAQLLVFIIIGRTPRWQYRLSLLILAMALSLAAMVLSVLARSPWVFAVSFAFIGGATSLAYVSGITYALHAGAEGRGRRAGIHEAVIGSGLVVGPLVGGVVAQYLNLRAPFAAAAVVYGLAVLGQLLLWWRRRQRP